MCNLCTCIAQNLTSVHRSTYDFILHTALSRIKDCPTYREMTEEKHNKLIPKTAWFHAVKKVHFNIEKLKL